MFFLSQNILQRPLFFRIHREQLRAQVGVLPVFVDGGLALGDGVVEHHQFFLVADHERRRWLVELRGGECFQVIDGVDVSLLGALDLIDGGHLQNVAIEVGRVHAPLRDPDGRAHRGQKENCRGDLPHARPRAAPFVADGALDPRP